MDSLSYGPVALDRLASVAKKVFMQYQVCKIHIARTGLPFPRCGQQFRIFAILAGRLRARSWASPKTCSEMSSSCTAASLLLSSFTVNVHRAQSHDRPAVEPPCLPCSDRPCV